MLIRMCDFCGKQMNERDGEYLIEATHFIGSGDARKSKPAMPAKEACPLCFNSLRPLIQGFDPAKFSSVPE